MKRCLSVGGFLPFSTIDYPDHLCAVVFCQGCTWRCRYCHNPHLQPFLNSSPINWDTIVRALKKRQGWLDSVVFSGGEPTMQMALQEAISVVKGLGFKIGLHTGGSFPKQLKTVLPMLDWVGMDWKAPLRKYSNVTQKENSGPSVLQSAHYVLESGIAAEFRLTVHPSLIKEADIIEIANRLAAMGASHFVLQHFKQCGCADEELIANDRPFQICAKLQIKLQRLFKQFMIR